MKTQSHENKDEKNGSSPFNIDAEQIKESAAEFADTAAKLIKKHPIQSVVGALVAGVLVGMLIKRK